MSDLRTVPGVYPRSLQALFPDLSSARVAIETMLQGGFHGEQLGLLQANDSVLSAANDMATYRATGLAGSKSTTGMDLPFVADDPNAKQEQGRQVELLRRHAVIVTVSPAEGQERNAREMLASLGGRLLREDGTLESREAA